MNDETLKSSYIIFTTTSSWIAPRSGIVYVIALGGGGGGGGGQSGVHHENYQTGASYYGVGSSGGGGGSGHIAIGKAKITKGTSYLITVGSGGKGGAGNSGFSMADFIGYAGDNGARGGGSGSYGLYINGSTEYSVCTGGGGGGGIGMLCYRSNSNSTMRSVPIFEGGTGGGYNKTNSISKSSWNNSVGGAGLPILGTSANEYIMYGSGGNGGKGGIYSNSTYDSGTGGQNGLNGLVAIYFLEE